MLFRERNTSGLVESINALTREIESDDTQAKDYFRNRIGPFFKNIWPNGRKDSLTSEISEAAANFCVRSGDNFHKVMQLPITKWLIPFPHPVYIITFIYDEKLCTKFPDDSLTLLSLIVDEINLHSLYKDRLRKCLNAIQESDNKLAESPEFKKLSELIE